MTSNQVSLDARSAIAIDGVSAALRERYALEREIGRGGSAYVYLARDLRDGAAVAVKVLRPELVTVVSTSRFLREVEIARSLRHPNIVELLDFGSVDGMLYYTMPYIKGATLRARLQAERQLPLPEALRIARDVAAALDYAHERNIVHRDVKPGNILLDGTRTLVTDFGIARAMTMAGGQELTDSGIALGTPEYMSPEQASGDRLLDVRTDIYALGCVVYEMIAGEAPFTGPNAQAIIARHAAEAPRSIRIIRGSVSPAVERAIEKALAKVPVDRFDRASLFADALELGLTSGENPPQQVPLHTRRTVILTSAFVALAVAGTYTLWPRRPDVSPNRIVVFPLNDQASRSDDEAGEAVATYIGYALDGTRPLKWLDGWELLSEEQRRNVGRVSSGVAARLAREAGAGFYIDGSILRRPDSATVILRLHSVVGDSVVGTAGASSAVTSASLPKLGLRAIADLLPALLTPQRTVDVSALSERHPTAIANFLQGEREYRRMAFHGALKHYEAATRLDSAFALAAVKGAAAANWTWETGTDRQLADVAMRGLSSLPPVTADFARGLHAYVNGAADSAIAHLRRAVAVDSSAHGALMILGEAYLRLLPTEPGFDSLGRAALSAARRVDAGFAPVLLLLQEIALRDGAISRALSLEAELRSAGADTSHTAFRRLMLSCVRNGASRMDWHVEVRRDQVAVLSAGKVLAGRAAQPACAVDAFRALVASDSVRDNRRWSALLGLNGLASATGRPAELASAFEALGVTRLPLGIMQMLAAAAGAGFERDAARFADSLGTTYETFSTARLYAIGTFEARRDSAARLNAIVRAMRAKVDSSRLRRDSLITRALTARLALVEGDTARAVHLLRELKPTGTRADIEWQPSESLGFERLVLAELLYSQGDFAGAIGVATLLDATEPVVYPLFLRPSLALRQRAAAAMQNDRLANEYGRRLMQLTVARP